MADSEFWSLTPYLLDLTLEAGAQNRVDEIVACAYTAWHTAAWSRTKKLPSFDRIRRKITGEQAPRQSPDEALEAAKQFVRRLGGEVKNNG